MKATAVAVALLMSGATIAQTTTQADVDADVRVHTDTGMDVNADMDATADMNSGTTAQTTTHDTMNHGMASMTSTTDAVAEPSNADPERDARGIAVISDPAFVPAGWNGVAVTAVGGPLVDPTTGTVVDAAETSYPSCTAEVTDNCVQAYARNRD